MKNASSKAMSMAMSSCVLLTLTAGCKTKSSSGGAAAPSVSGSENLQDCYALPVGTKLTDKSAHISVNVDIGSDNGAYGYGNAGTVQNGAYGYGNAGNGYGNGGLFGAVINIGIDIFGSIFHSGNGYGYANSSYANGAYGNSTYTNGTYTNGTYTNGTYTNGTYTNGTYTNGGVIVASQPTQAVPVTPPTTVEPIPGPTQTPVTTTSPCASPTQYPAGTPGGLYPATVPASTSACGQGGVYCDDGASGQWPGSTVSGTSYDQAVVQSCFAAFRTSGYNTQGAWGIDVRTYADQAALAAAGGIQDTGSGQLMVVIDASDATSALQFNFLDSHALYCIQGMTTQTNVTINSCYSANVAWGNPAAVIGSNVQACNN